MSIKSILVHLANDDDHLGRLRVGYDLARRHGAHLTALYVLSPISMPYAIEGRGASVNYLQEAVEAARDKAKVMETEFHEWCARNGVSCRWVAEEGDHLKLLARHSHYADVAIVSQTEPDNLEERIFNELPDHLAMVGSCPVIVLPHGYGGTGPLGRRILLAWKDGRQCARATRDALPFLEAADHVVVAMVEPKERDKVSSERVQEWLRLHGTPAELVHVARSGRTVATALLDTAAGHGCDLMVMGGYGHSRLHELVLGGTTHEILSGVQLPVLMSH